MGSAAVDALVHAVNDYKGRGWAQSDFPHAAEFLIDRGWQPGRALELLRQARVVIEEYRARNRDNDNFSDDELKRQRSGQIEEDQRLNALVLRASIQLGNPEQALKLRSSVATPPPQEKRFESEYWANRARLEALQNHAMDALAYYQLALNTRTEIPQMRHGRFHDILTDEVRAFWKVHGGTEAAWMLWDQRSPGASGQSTESDWENPGKAIPSFELSDLSGKTWTLKDLAGKAILINVWATWCGPCEAELPHVQKLYDQVKNRSDIQILTFSIDGNIGDIAPYLKAHGYTFPVLPVGSAGILTEFGRSAELDRRPARSWRWKKLGYGGGTYADFEREMLGRLESAKTSQ